MRALKAWEKNHCGSDDPALIQAIFARRHRVTVTLFLTVLVPPFVLPPVCIYLLGIPEAEIQNGAITPYAVLFLVLLMIVLFAFVVLRYRCPRCNAVPNSSQAGTGGILLFPRECANCGAPLMQSHPWAQQ